jgi:hypothetical protein
MSIEEAVDQVKVAGAAATRAGREFPAQLSLCASRKRGSFFVAHVDPFQLLIEPQRIG